MSADRLVIEREITSANKNAVENANVSKNGNGVEVMIEGSDQSSQKDYNDLYGIWSVLSRRRFIVIFLASIGGLTLLYDGPYVGLGIRNFLRDKTHLTVTIESVEGLQYNKKFDTTAPPQGGGVIWKDAFPASFPSAYSFTVDVHGGPTETFQVEFNVNDGNESVHIVIKENGNMKIRKDDMPIPIPGTP